MLLHYGRHFKEYFPCINITNNVKQQLTLDITYIKNSENSNFHNSYISLRVNTELKRERIIDQSNEDELPMLTFNPQ